MTQKRKKIGLFGGSFNPPHVCHTLTTVWAMQTHQLDEVWWMPTFRHAFDKALVPYDQRREMCARAIAGLTGVTLCDIERDLGGESRTVDTVRVLRAQNPEHDYALIVGSDILAETERWKDWDGLMKLVDLIVIGRAGHLGDAAPDSTEFRLPNVSSTEIRRKLTARDYLSLRYWMARDVLEYIQVHQLYEDHHD